MSETLLADIGGSRVRFSLLVDEAIGPVEEADAADFGGPAAAAAAYVDASGAAPRRAVFAVAGPVDGGPVRLTNSGWVVDAAALERDLGLERLRLVNDLAAIAWAVPELDGDAVSQIGGGVADRAAPAACIAPGTGLGVAAYVPQGGGHAIAGEGGHVTLASADAREDAIVAALRARFGHASAERALSGPGLANLYAAIAELDGAPVDARTPEEVSEAAVSGTCAVAREALARFCAMLGTVAGNLALTLGARGGVYIAGGIVPGILDFVAASDFRARFEAKGRFADYLRRIPTYAVVHPHPALLGLAALARRQRD